MMLRREGVGEGERCSVLPVHLIIDILGALNQQTLETKLLLEILLILS